MTNSYTPQTVMITAPDTDSVCLPSTQSRTALLRQYPGHVTLMERFYWLARGHVTLILLSDWFLVCRFARTADMFPVLFRCYHSLTFIANHSVSFHHGQELPYYML